MPASKEYKANTLKTAQVAIKSFEHATDKKVCNATAQDLEAWMRHLRGEGISINTCRTYLSMVKQLVDAEADMPKRESTVKRVLSEKEIKYMLSVAPAKEYAWLAVCLLVGPESLIWTWGRLYDPNRIIELQAYLLIVEEAKRRGYKTFEFPYRGQEQAHWVDGYDRNALIWDMTQRETNRRLRLIAKHAGIGVEKMNLTTLRYSHQQLVARHASAEQIAKALGIAAEGVAPKPKPAKYGTGLYGIGRRSPSFIKRA